MKLTERQLATILASLRFWQARTLQKDWANYSEIATDLGQFSMLTKNEIDALCEQLNMGETKP